MSLGPSFAPGGKSRKTNKRGEERQRGDGGRLRERGGDEGKNKLKRKQTGREVVEKND